MKKIISAFLMAVCCMLMAVPAQAQLLKWGVKGGVNMTKIDWSGGVKGNKGNSAGFFIGPMAEVTVPVIGLGLDAALMYSQRGKDYDITVDNGRASVEAKQQGFEIPVNLKYTIGLGSTLGIYFAAGPDFFFNFKDVEVNVGNLGIGGNGKLVDSKKTQVGLNLGAGLKLLEHLQLGVNYQLPLGDSFSLGDAFSAVGNDISGKGAKTKTWQVSAAYIF